MHDHGPFQTSSQAGRASLWETQGRHHGLGIEAANRIDLGAALAGLDLGEFDRRILDWLARDTDPATVSVIVGLIERARRAGRHERIAAGPEIREIVVEDRGGWISGPCLTLEPPPPPPPPPDPEPEPPACQCPKRDGKIYHQRATCTDPVARRLDWFADPEPPDPKMGETYAAEFGHEPPAPRPRPPAEPELVYWPSTRGGKAAAIAEARTPRYTRPES